MSPPPESFPTHEVTNQPPPLPSINLFEGDIALVEAVRRSGAEGAEPHLKKSGKLAGDERVQDLARLAHRYQPELRAFDRFGHRKDAVEFHPAYHELMQLVFGDGVHSLAWTAREGGHAARTALSYIWNQADQGVNCPTSMTYASVRALRNDPVLAAALETRNSRQRLRPAVDPLQGQERHHRRHGDDGKTGRLGFARHRDRRGAGR